MNEKDGDLKKTQRGLILAKPGIFSIANQLRYGLVLSVILSLLITAGWLIFLAFQTQVQQLEVAQRERSRAAAGEINAYLDVLQRKLSYLARVRGLSDITFVIQADLLEGLARHNDAYETVAILDRTGQVVMALGDRHQTLPDNLATSPLFLRTFKQQEDYVGPVEINPITGLPEVTLAVPIRDWQDKVGGVLLAKVNLKFLWFIVSQARVGETGYVYVLDNRNLLIAEKGSSAETFKLQDISDQRFIQNLTSGNVDPLTPYQGLQGQAVLGAIAPVRSLHWNVVVELPTAEAYTPIRNMLLVMGGALGLITIIAVSLGIYFSRQIVLPLRRLTEASTQISAGNMETQVKVSSRNELGVLATAFNEMASQLRALYGTLEQQVAARTRRLEVVATLGENLSGILNVEELLTKMVNQIKDSFGYYHAHVYLLDDNGENLVVAEGTGEAGAEMKAKGHSIRLDAQTSLVARAARSGEIVRVDDVREAEDWLPNPLLPHTSSEMAVPIILEGQVVGVLDVQEDKVVGLDESDANLLRSLVNQVAITMRNARLFAEVETALAEAYAAQARYVEQSWEKGKIVTRHGEYHYTQPGVLALSETNAQALAEAKLVVFRQNRLTTVNINGDDSDVTAVVSPIMLRDIPIGALQVCPANGDQLWTEDDLAVIEAVSEELAQMADNLRLFDEARERAGREQTIREITEKMRATTSLQELVKTTARELGQRLSAGHAVLEMGLDLSALKGEN